VEIRVIRGSTILFLAHPAERHVAAAVAGSPCCSCCCCCSCCLHAAGGLVGASVGSGQALLKTNDRDKAVFGVAVYWGVFALLAVASTIAVAFAYEAFVALIYIVLCAPAVQLVASLVALGVVAVSPVPNKGPAYSALGWIALWSVVGSAAGLAVMIALGALGYLIFS
jgi:hypothetical protein